jgi:hypothetical protein
LEFLGADQCSYGLAVRSDDDRITVFGGPNVFAELGFDVSNGSIL